MGKDYKELEIILGSYDCDKDCPYCTAKITRWDKVEDNLTLLGFNVAQLKELGYTFKYVTLGGNGEPTKYSYNQLKKIVQMFRGWDGSVKKVLTSGNIFRPENEDKYRLFVDNGWLFECTVTSSDIRVSNQEQGYDFDYLSTDAFKDARVRMNLALIKGRDYVSEANELLSRYPNIEMLCLKLLNVNTRTGEVDNGYSKWVVDNAIPKEQRDLVADRLNRAYRYVNGAFDAHWWEYGGRRVYFSWKKASYGLFDLVWYGDRFVDYQLNTVKLPLLPKIYFGGKFYVNHYPDGTVSLGDDFRTPLVGGGGIVDFRYDAFIRDARGIAVAQYVAPFYNEEASGGVLTNDSCQDVVRSEIGLLGLADVCAFYYNEEESPGNDTELVYSVMQGKNVVALYKDVECVTYRTKSKSWFPLVFAQQHGADVRAVSRAWEAVDYVLGYLGGVEC